MSDRFVPFSHKPQIALDLQARYRDAIVEVGLELVQKRVREVGNTNSGPWVDKFLRFVGITEPSPWCTAVACWTLQEAARRIGAKDDTCPDFASGAKLWRWAMQQDISRCILIKRPGDALPGDVLILGATVAKARTIARGSLASGHTCILRTKAHGSDGWFGTFEGNTNAEGSRDGQGFYERWRAWSDPRIVGAIRFYAVE